MTRVKICGITNQEDLQAAVSYGADALGFIAVPNSPRYISPEHYTNIALPSPMFVPQVIVVDRPEDARYHIATYVQHYADTTDRYWREARCTWRIRAFRVRDESSLHEIATYPDPVGAVLLDTYHQDKLGGSGETFNWELAVEAKRLTDRPIILAGGLTPDNVQDALEAVRPYAVDVSSGVEAGPGVKDHAKVKAFIRAVQEWDLRHG